VLIDESGFFLNPTVRRTYAPVGQTPVLQGFGRHRDKVSVIAALSVSPLAGRVGLYFATDAEAYLSNHGVADFLGQLLRHLRGRVLVVWDRGNNHRGDPIWELCGRYERLTLVELPGYAPELNPVECLWAYVKHGRLANHVPRNVYELEDTVAEHLIESKWKPSLLRKIWQGSQLPFPTRHCSPEGQ
jgi:transposase